MIVAVLPEELLVVTQNDHAHFAGELLSLWRADDLPEHPRRRDLLFAAREHDNGWREADAAPSVDPATGRPFDFITFPLAARQEVWRRGVGRFLEREPYAALLILQHAIHLHRDHYDEPGWRELLAEWRALRSDLLAECGVAREALAADYRCIELADLLSLGLCCRWRKEIDLHGYRAQFAADRLVLHPFPLAGATTFRIPSRRISDRRYTGDADFGVTLATARWEEWTVRVTPASEPFIDDRV